MNNNFCGRIIQILDALSYGDAVSNQVLLMDSLFKRLGYSSLIFTKWHDERLSSKRDDISQMNATENDIIIIHFYGYSDYAVPAAISAYSTRIMVYHNITPKEFFNEDTEIYKFCSHGREQLTKILPKFHRIWGVSQFNINEIIALGYPADKCDLIPIIIDKPPFEDLIDKENGIWLFTGRIAPNKDQVNLIKLFSSVRAQQAKLAKKLYLVGAYDENDSYCLTVKKTIFDLSLQNSVFIVGKVSNEELLNYYRISSLFVCVSQHEGFGVPLIEAALAGLPVVALSTSGVSETLGYASTLAKDYDEMRKIIIKIHNDPTYKNKVIKEQFLNTKRFSSAQVEIKTKKSFEYIIPKEWHYKYVSIVICTYNRLSYLERLLDYLKYQTVSSFEVIVVDGPSVDGTKDFLRGYDKILKIYHNPERNLSRSRNIGIEASSGDLIAFIDDDAIPFDDWVESILKNFNSRPLTTAGVGGPVYYAGSLKFQVEDIGFNNLAVAKQNIESSEIGKNNWVRSLLGTNSIFTRESLLEIDGFDEEYDYFLDESDLCFRLQKRNNLIGFDSDLLLRHEFAEGPNRTGKYKYNWYSISKNTAYFIYLYSGLIGEELNAYIKHRLTEERIDIFEHAYNRGEITRSERDNFIGQVLQGMARGIKDAASLIPTRTLNSESTAFLPYLTTSCHLRVGHEIKRLHICIVSKEFPPFASRGGIGTMFYQLASELLLLGHEVTVIVPADKDDTFKQGRIRIIYARKEILSIPGLDDGFINNISWTTAALKAFSSLHSVHPVDIIESALWDAEALAIALLPTSDRPPLVVRLVSPIPVVERINNWNVPKNILDFFKGAELALINSADAVVPISDSIASTIESEYGLLRNKRWYKINCGIKYWPSFDVNCDYSQFNDFDNIPDYVFESSKLIVFIGRLEKRKGIDLVLHAASIFLESDINSQLLIAGNDTGNWQEYARDNAESDIFKRIHFLGEISDSTRDKLLAKAYCLLYPSRYESFGLVPLEAFVHGVPVIASNSGAIPEVVEDGVSGFIFDPYDSDSLARAVVTLLDDPLLRTVMSLNAKKRVKELSSRNMAINTVDLYSLLIKGDR